MKFLFKMSTIKSYSLPSPTHNRISADFGGMLYIVVIYCSITQKNHRMTPQHTPNNSKSNGNKINDIN